MSAVCWDMWIPQQSTHNINHCIYVAWLVLSFLPRDAMLAQYMLWPFVHLSLCLSVKVDKFIITETTPHSSTSISGF